MCTGNAKQASRPAGQQARTRDADLSKTTDYMHITDWVVIERKKGGKSKSDEGGEMRRRGERVAKS
jgi:hypothetical protein